MTQIQKLLSLLGMFSTMPLANRNIIVDGNKDVWSGTTASLNTTGQYTPCVMMAARAGAAGVASYTQGAWTAAPHNPTQWGMSQPLTFYGQFNQTTQSSGTVAARTCPALWYPIENVMTMEGQSFTLSVWLWTNSGTATVNTVFFDQNFGTGGSPSATVLNSVAVNWTVTNIPTRFSVRIDVPSIAGMTIGTTTNGYTQVGLCYPIGSTFVINDSQWQLEKCSPQAPATGNPTVFEYRGAGPEYHRVQRYWSIGTLVFNGPTTSGSQYGANYPYKAFMRATPAVTFATAAGSGFPASAPSVGGASSIDALAGYMTANATATNSYWSATFTADARM